MSQHEHYMIRNGPVWECECGEIRNRYGHKMDRVFAELERHTGPDMNARQLRRVELLQTKPEEAV